MSAPAHLAASEAHLLLAYLPAGHRAALAHALACTPCRQLLSDLLEALAALPSAETAANAGAPAELAAVAAALAAECAAAEQPVAELLAAPARERRRLLDGDPRFHTLPVAWLLLDRAVAAIDGEPWQAEGLARLALRIAARLGGTDREAVERAILETRGWAVVANVRWNREDWPGARLALERTEKGLVRARLGAASPAVRDLLAAIRLSEQQIAEDFALAAHAVRTLLLVARDPAVMFPSPSEHRRE
ncbi:MAG TPA: hypothetical protein VF121_07995 [Thermoanaerobaculia bacterium]|nr:hypothetical protein [Thermoanaerobaculia bacterium]